MYFIKKKKNLERKRYFTSTSKLKENERESLATQEPTKKRKEKKWILLLDNLVKKDQLPGRKDR